MTADKGGDLLLTDIIAHNADNRNQKEQNFLNRTPKKLRVTGKALIWCEKSLDVIDRFS